MIEPRLEWPVEALLGEGPAWFPAERALRFVDIKGGRLHRYVPETGERETRELGGNPSFVVPAEDGRLIVGSRARLSLVGEHGCEPLGEIAMPAHNRTNDATVDPQGRLWFGTMDDEERLASGSLYCWDRGRLHATDLAAVVTNGPAVGADGRTLYFVDSAQRTIWRYRIGDGPALADGEVFLRLGEDEGYPDGVVLDSEDCLWVALWDGWGVRRYAPDGTLLDHIELPCARVTKLGFGGADLRTAFVTTARVGLSHAHLASQPLAGSLFSFAAPAPGRALPAVRLAT